MGVPFGLGGWRGSITLLEYCVLHRIKKDHRLVWSHACEETHVSQSAGYGIFLFDLTEEHGVASHASISGLDVVALPEEACPTGIAVEACESVERHEGGAAVPSLAEERLCIGRQSKS